jgi:hypothetical protein
MTIGPDVIGMVSGKQLWTGFGVDFKYAAGRVYSTSGRIYEAESGIFVGAGFTGVVAPDPGSGSVYWLRPGLEVEVTTLRGAYIAPLRLSNVSLGAANLVRWGEDGLAFTSPVDGVVLWRSALVADTDTDGLPDAWERRYFGGTDTPKGGADQDPDGDGLTNAQELAAGSNPLDPNDALRLNAFLLGGRFSLRWPSVVGRRYRLERSLTLPVTWQTLMEDIAGTGGTLTFTETNLLKAQECVYRLELQR